MRAGWIIALSGAHARDSARVGGKAAGLAALAAAGLPVPDGVVVAVDAFRRACGDGLAGVRPSAAPTAADTALLADARAHLVIGPLADAIAAAAPPSPWAVRSSATIEDTATGGAPGLFRSRRPVDRGGLEAAVREVWASAFTPAVWAYLAARGLGFDELAMAVVVQSDRGDRARGTIYTRAPDRPDALLLEQALPAPAWRELSPDEQSLRGGGELAVDAASLARLARRASAAIGAESADIEWVSDDHGTLWLVQARPVPPPRGPRRLTPPPGLFAFSRAEPALSWRWDITHNPEPLSPAQIGLVERVDALGVGTHRMRVVAGYLYAARARQIDDDDRELEARVRDDWSPACERALGAVEPTPVGLATALETYDRIYRLYASLAPRLARAKRRLPGELAALFELDAAAAEALAHRLLGGARGAGLESRIAAAARGELSRAQLAAFAAPLSPAWDVAAPTYGERPATLDAAVARATGADAGPRADALAAELRARLSPAAARRFDRALGHGRAAAELGELDDRYFARAQAAVRRALVSLGGDDACYVPLAEALRGRIDPTRAAHARRRLAAQRALAMPLAFSGGAAPLRQATRISRRGRLEGRGCGGQLAGTIARLDRLDAFPELADDAILLVATVTPAMAPLLALARAVISEHGGLLDHGAAIARELGVPCVVGCAGAREALRDGDRVWLDADAGTVVLVA